MLLLLSFAFAISHCSVLHLLNVFNVLLQVMPHAAFRDLLSLSKESVMAEPLTMQQVSNSRKLSCHQLLLLYTVLYCLWSEDVFLC